MKARITPLSPKAKNRFANSLRCNPLVDIEQVDNGQIFFVSPTGYCAWTPFPHSHDWDIKLLPPEPAHR